MTADERRYMVEDLLSHGWIRGEQVVCDTQIHGMYQDLLLHLIGGDSPEDANDQEPAANVIIPPQLVPVVIIPEIDVHPVVELPVVVVELQPLVNAAEVVVEMNAAPLINQYQVIGADPTCVVCMSDDVIPAFTDGCMHRDCCEQCLLRIIAESITPRCPLCRARFTRVL